MPSLSYAHLSPGTYLQEKDLSARVAMAVATSGAAAYESKKGSLGPTFYSSGRRFIELNGKADPSISFAHDCILAFMEESSQFWGNRVVNGSLYAGMSYVKDTSSKKAVDALKTRILPYPWPIGSTTPYTSGGVPTKVLSLADALITANSFTFNITDGTSTEAVGPVVYATSHNNTMNLIAAAIQTALGEFGSGGSAVVVQEASGNNYVIIVRDPAGASLIYSTPAITLGVSQTTATVDTTAKVIDVVSENPGTWANKVGVKLVGFDVGTAQRFSITFNNALVTSNVVTAIVNGRVVSTTFATNSDTTMAAFAAALQADVDIATASVKVVAGAVDNDRTIEILAAPAAPNALQISSVVVTLGSSQALAVIQETLKGRQSVNTFAMEVYTKENVTLPAERFRSLSLGKYINGMGVQTKISDQVNSSANRSDNVRVYLPLASESLVLSPELYENSYVIDKTINWLTGGTDGSAVLNSQIREGWKAFRNREKIPARLFINCGYTDPSVQQEMIAIAEYRNDAFAILDMPSDKQLTQDAYNHRMQTMNIDSSYGAIYSPDLLIADDESDELRYVPPSGHVAARYAYTERTSKLWFAPAGLRRGKISRIRGLRVDYEQGDRDLLNPIGVNCIIDKIGNGPVIWGEETLQVEKTVLSAVHARLLLNMLKMTIADGLDYVALFQPNNAQYRFQAKQLIDRVLLPIVNEEGLYYGEAIVDERNNTDQVIEQEVMACDMYLDIVRTSKRVILTSILTPKGVEAAELIVDRPRV